MGLKGPLSWPCVGYIKQRLDAEANFEEVATSLGLRSGTLRFGLNGFLGEGARPLSAGASGVCLPAFRPTTSQQTSPTKQIHRCIQTRAYMHVCTHICIHAYLHACIHTLIDACMHACMRYAHTCIHSYVHTYVHTCVRTYVHTYIHTHTYIHA